MINIAEKIDRLAEIKAETDKLKQEKDCIEAELLKVAEEDLANTKYKSVTYKGEKAIVKATTAATVKVNSETFLPFIFGKAYSEYCKPKSSVDLTPSAKRIISDIWTGNFIQNTVLDVIQSMNLDSMTEKVIAKKCKGTNYEKDKQNLINFAGMTAEKAEENAYFLYEAAAWQRFSVILEINDIEDDKEIAILLQKIQAAFSVEETPKISVEVI